MDVVGAATVRQSSSISCLDVPALANVPSCVVPGRHAVSESFLITSQDHHILTPGLTRSSLFRQHQGLQSNVQYDVVRHKTREKLQDTHIPDFKLQLYNVIGAREYELPTGDMLGAIVYETYPEGDMDYDIILERRSGYPQRGLFVGRGVKWVDPTRPEPDKAL
ncbi:hypothetical protein Tco_0487933 [Tanacetum coccineum]